MAATAHAHVPLLTEPVPMPADLIASIGGPDRAARMLAALARRLRTLAEGGAVTLTLETDRRRQVHNIRVGCNEDI